MLNVWGLLPKATDDPTTVSEEILADVDSHNTNPDAHLADGQSLTTHRASEIIDHVARSIVNDKVIEVARAYTAILKTPILDTENLFFAGIDSSYPALTVVSPTKTAIEILSRTDSGDDSEYVYFPTNVTEYSEFYMTAPVLPLGQKLYSIKVKFRAKLLNANVASGSPEFFWEDGSVEGYTITSTWQNFEKELFFLMDAGDNYKIITQDTLDAYFMGLMYACPSGIGANNQLAISKFYIEASVPSDADKEDFFALPDAIDYVNSLGGGSIFIKNGTYNSGMTVSYVDSYVEIIGESLAGVILNASGLNYNIVIGSDKVPEYTAGTITLTQNSASVVASGVTWTSAKTVGKYLLNKASGHYYKILSWQDSTHVTIDTLYQGQTTASLAYLIIEMKEECKIQNVTMTYELILHNALNITIDNVKFKSGYISYKYLENLQLVNCDLENISGTELYDYISNSKFINNTFKNYTTTCFWGKITCVGNIFEDNLFIDCKGQCLILYGYNHLIKGNIILNCGWTLGSLFSPIILGSTSKYITVVQNTVRLCATYGIGSQTGANYNIVAENIVIDNGQAGVVNIGANSVTANNIV